MDKNAIKKYAVWARRELIEKVSQKALQYGIEDGREYDSELDSFNGKLFTETEKKQRRALINRINEEGYKQAMEEVAYTWFNRFVALRFMEVNGYLPSHLRVFTDENNNFNPQILTEALHLEFEGLDKEKVLDMKQANQDDELYKYLLIEQCNDLNSSMPIIFQTITDYTVLLLPDYLLREGSVIQKLIIDIPEEDWKEQVQIIGWMYQYYNIEPKDEVFAALKKSIRISKEKIPAATQLFTPEWIVRYMVDNSLGKVWLSNNPESKIKEKLNYYVDEPIQEADVDSFISDIRRQYADIQPENIKCIDPCMGSGHVISYIFDVLVSIYEDAGYTTRDAVEKIITKNIFGLDIDERAAQLASFSLMMKARQYDRRFLSRKIRPNVYSIKESNNLQKEVIEAFCEGRSDLKDNINRVVEALHDAKEYGSILSVENVDFEILYERIEQMRSGDVNTIFGYMVDSELVPLIDVAHILAQKYTVVVTNPPYMSSAGMDVKLQSYVNKHFPNSKYDMFAVFMESCSKMLDNNGYLAMITQHAWMFLSSFKKFRTQIMKNTVISMAHLGAHAFEEIGGEIVQTTAFVMTPVHIKGYKGCYIRLVDEKSQDAKEERFLSGENRYFSAQDNYLKTPGGQIAYWVGPDVLKHFGEQQKYFETHAGITTGDNEYFLKYWTEIDARHIYREKQDDDVIPAWYFHHKGGLYRKWYGNNELVLHYDQKAIEEMKTRPGFRHDGKEFYFREAATWNKSGTGNICLRYSDSGNTFNTGGCCLFAKTTDQLLYFMALLNSNVMKVYLDFLCPTFSFAAGDVEKVPVIYSQNERVTELVKENIAIARKEWDSFETSWDFMMHPLVIEKKSVKEAYNRWEEEREGQFNQLKNNEEELNRIFIDIYELNDSVSYEISDKDISLRKADLERDIKSLISYAVGCMFGRYSLDAPGLSYASGNWDESLYKTYLPDKDAIIPICDDEYFEDDIVGRFVSFIETVYGKDELENNLQFIADALGGKGSAREVIRNYFINDFYADHVKIYQKRPIYWLFDSGKKNGFKCLIYMHRYQPDTIARIRTDYVHEQQARYRTAIEETEKRIESAAGSDKVKLTKKLNTLKAQDEEIHAYEEKIHHLADQMISIDLDDGVKHNYEIFKDVLAKIK